MSKKDQNVQEDSRCKGKHGNTYKKEIKCVCLNARSIINKKNELNIMVDDIKPRIIGITESWANNDITYIGPTMLNWIWKVMQCLGKTELEEGEEECYYTSGKLYQHMKYSYRRKQNSTCIRTNQSSEDMRYSAVCTERIR